MEHDESNKAEICVAVEQEMAQNNDSEELGKLCVGSSLDKYVAYHLGCFHISMTQYS